MRAGDVPGVNDVVNRFVAGLLDEPQALLQRVLTLDRGELDAQSRADVLRLGRELGEPVRPKGCALPRAVVTVWRDLEVPGVERFGGLEQAEPDPLGFLPVGSVVPPVRDPLELEVRDAVVGEHGSDAGQPVRRHGGGQIVREQTEASVAG